MAMPPSYVSDHSSTADALATDPTGCTSQFVTDMAANGTLTCSNSINGTLGTEKAPALTDANWTVGAGWESPVAGGVLNKNADGVGTATPTAATNIVAGTAYKVVITLSACTVGSATLTLGGVTGHYTLSAATTYTDYITAITTGKLIITPAATSARFTVSAISIKPVTSGSLTVENGITMSGGQLLVGGGSGTYPAIAPVSDPDTGIYFNPGVGVDFYLNGVFMGRMGNTTNTATTLYIGYTDLPLQREGAATLQMGVDAATATAQIIKAADSTGASNPGASLTLKGGTAGAGGTNGAVIHGTMQSDTPQAVTCTDSGDGNHGALTITASSSFVRVTNNDANGCNITLSETGAVDGQFLEVWNVSANHLDIADSDAVQELSGAIVLATWQHMLCRYTTDRWMCQ